jgi:hypothetical protein
MGRLAMGERGPDLQARRYDDWRLEYMRREGFRGRRPASSVFISKRLGGWRTARRLGHEWLVAREQFTQRGNDDPWAADGSDRHATHGKDDG